MRFANYGCGVGVRHRAAEQWRPASEGVSTTAVTGTPFRANAAGAGSAGTKGYPEGVKTVSNPVEFHDETAWCAASIRAMAEEPITSDSIETVPIQTVTVADFYVPNEGQVWRVERVERVEHPKVGVVYELYKGKDEPSPAITEREGTKIRCIRRPS